MKYRGCYPYPITQVFLLYATIINLTLREFLICDCMYVYVDVYAYSCAYVHVCKCIDIRVKGLDETNQQ